MDRSDPWVKPEGGIPSGANPACASLHAGYDALEIHLVPALERQDLARFVGRRYLEAEALEDLPRQPDLLCIAAGEPARPGPQRILEPDAHIATHRGSLGGDAELRRAGAENRPAILIPEQPVGRALHVHHVLRMRA